jgi:hypothetical protein
VASSTLVFHRLRLRSSERGKQVVVIVVIDEAHLLDAESLEGVRCLSDADMDQSMPFCLLLLGQPTRRRRLRMGALAALDQQIGCCYTIGGLDATETAGYISHHLALAGRQTRRDVARPTLTPSALNPPGCASAQPLAAKTVKRSGQRPRRPVGQRARGGRGNSHHGLPRTRPQGRGRRSSCEKLPPLIFLSLFVKPDHQLTLAPVEH